MSPNTTPNSHKRTFGAHVSRSSASINEIILNSSPPAARTTTVRRVTRTGSGAPRQSPAKGAALTASCAVNARW